MLSTTHAINYAVDYALQIHIITTSSQPELEGDDDLCTFLALLIARMKELAILCCCVDETHSSNHMCNVNKSFG